MMTPPPKTPPSPQDSSGGTATLDAESLSQRIDWDARQISAYQLRRLREHVAFMKRHSPWHARRLENVRPDEMDVTTLQSIPSMSKFDVLRDFDEIVTDRQLSLDRCRAHLNVERAGGDLLLGRYRVGVSGGSSGTQAVTVLTPDEMVYNADAALRFVRRWATRSAVLPASPVVVGITTPDTTFRALQVVRSFQNGTVLSVTSPTADIVASLNSIKPDILMTYPSVLPRLMYEVRAGRLAARPKLILGGAEPLLPAYEEVVREAWGCPIIDGWGSSEVGVLAVGSGFESGMLLLEDMAVVEFVDGAGAPVEPGVRSAKVFVTPLYRSALPLLRYELTDQVKLLPEPAVCGSGFRRISSGLFRTDDAFTYGGRTVQPDVFRSILGRFREVLEYQVRQTSDGVRLLVASAAPFDPAPLEAEIHGQLRAAGLQDPRVAIEMVSSIPRVGMAAKLKHFVPLAA
jgi:phenylacetate-coenzyme A ligase PaaK-like adenylate-forming protein